MKNAIAIAKKELNIYFATSRPPSRT